MASVNFFDKNLNNDRQHSIVMRYAIDNDHKVQRALPFSLLDKPLITNAKGVDPWEPGADRVNLSMYLYQIIAVHCHRQLTKKSAFGKKQKPTKEEFVQMFDELWGKVEPLVSGDDGSLDTILELIEIATSDSEQVQLESEDNQPAEKRIEIQNPVYVGLQIYERSSDDRFAVTLQDVVQEHLNTLTNEVTAQTIGKYKNAIKHLNSFQKQKWDGKEIYLDLLDRKFLSHFQDYVLQLKTREGEWRYENVSINQFVKKLRAAVEAKQFTYPHINREMFKPRHLREPKRKSSVKYAKYGDVMKLRDVKFTLESLLDVPSLLDHLGSDLWCTSDLMSVLGVDRQTVYKWTIQGMPVVRKNISRYENLFSKKQVVAWLESRELIQGKLLALERARDFFCFNCDVPVRYQNLEQLMPSSRKTFVTEHSEIGTYLELVAWKNVQPLCLPLTDYALSILEKYKGKDKKKGRLLPIPTNQYLNLWLTAALRVSGLFNYKVGKLTYRGREIIQTHPFAWQELTVHSARHTAATNLLATNSMDLPTIQVLLGHENIATTQIYADMIPEHFRDVAIRSYRHLAEVSRKKAKVLELDFGSAAKKVEVLTEDALAA